MVTALRGAMVCGAMALLSACSSSNNGAQLEADAGALAAPGQVPGAATAWEAGGESRFCPQVTLREGTAILRKNVGDQVDYVASISEANRDCRIIDGRLRMQIGVAGRIVPGAAAQARTVNLPIRVAVLLGEDVIYSELGRQAVAIAPGGGAKTFRYLDQGISLDPNETRVVIYAGFDEGPPE
ncbi:hypothetical protein [Aurantimonas endophytica]|uniref:Lipoprotein n=1 Tax=Aurantimonas endophytica TaxID=1522175 RepID=A0A7W6HDJ0_9HYPH|nr:hypothetical protein [Aurantimonas endophytica]MBB4002998.1 hypothetical protein [Aurantimonas endophytica]MCO6403873.1 hypothetical protein [Aurantimonas endophytica]